MCTNSRINCSMELGEVKQRDVAKYVRWPMG